MMDVVSISETSVYFYETTWRKTGEGSHHLVKNNTYEVLSHDVHPWAYLESRSKPSNQKGKNKAGVPLWTYSTNIVFWLNWNEEVRDFIERRQYLCKHRISFDNTNNITENMSVRIYGTDIWHSLHSRETKCRLICSLLATLFRPK
jgi:hypothetical protein